MTFTVFDIIIFIILTIYSVIGVYKGLVKSLLSFFAFIAAIISAYFLFPLIEQLLIEYFLLSNEMAISILASIVAYFPCLIVANFISAKLYTIIKGLVNNLADRVLGLLAGFMKGGLVCLALFIFTATITTGNYIQADTLYDITRDATNDKYPNWLRNSYTCSYLDKFSRNVILLFSEDSLRSIKLPTIPTVKESIELDKNPQSNKDSIIVNEPMVDEELAKELKEMIK